MVALVRSAWCDINLEAIETNATVLAELAGAPLLPIVKANAYGHGAGPVVERLSRLKQVWGMGVILVAEATFLREQGYTGRILIPGGLLPEQAEEAISSGAIIALSDMEVAKSLDRVATMQKKEVGVHIKVDVGMHRLGFPYDVAETVAAEISSYRGLHLEGVITHLAAAHSGDAASRVRSGNEVERFAVLVRLLRSRYGDIVAHAANSSALLSMDNVSFDLVRPGLAVYGWRPAEWLPEEPELRPALAVRSRVVVEKRTAAGALVGYSQTPVAEGRRLGVLPIGYADGIPQEWGLAGGYVLFHAGAAPLVGSVSMDSCVVDITDLPSEGVGSTALLLGSGTEGTISPTEMGKATRRGPYEILVGLNGRLPRRYHN